MYYCKAGLRFILLVSFLALIFQESVKAAVLDVQQEKGKASIIFPSIAATRAAAFIKDKMLWVVFDKSLDLEPPTTQIQGIKSITKASIGNLYSCFLLDIEEDFMSKQVINMQHFPDSWILNLSSEELAPEWLDKYYTIKVNTKPVASPAPRVELEIGEIFKTLAFQDPFTGAKMFVVATLRDNVGIQDSYTFIDFNILTSPQGVAIEAVNDSLVATINGTELYITNQEGLKLAPKIYYDDAVTKKDRTFLFDEKLSYDRNILFLKKFTISDQDFLEIEKNLWNAAKDRDPDKWDIYINISQFYLANNMYKEASAVIELLQSLNKEYVYRFDSILINAVSAFMDQKYQTASDIIDKIDIADIPVNLRKEIRFWYGLIKYKAFGKNIVVGVDIVDFFNRRTYNFLNEYTPCFITEMLLSSVENTISQENHETSIKLLQLLNELKDNMTYGQYNRYLYDTGTLHAAKGSVSEAIANWDECIDDIDDLFHRVQCSIAKADFLYKTGGINTADYIKELEVLTTIWRGDDIEITNLEKLGNLYYKQKLYIDALRAWKAIADNYKDTSNALMISQQMHDIFVNYFLNPGKKTNPFESAALFYEFQDLVPIGDVGDEIAISFAEILVELDLLSQASALLNHLVENRLQGIRKEEVINILAQIHYLNDRPFNTLEILYHGDNYEILPDHIAKERRQIHAKALVKLHQIDAVEGLLKGDNSQEADSIRADAYWINGDWSNFDKNSEPYLYKIWDNGEILSKEEVEKVVRQVVSYIMGAKDEPLENLYKNFYSKMPKNNKYSKVLPKLANLWQYQAPMDGKQDTAALQKIMDEVAGLLEEKA